MKLKRKRSLLFAMLAAFACILMCFNGCSAQSKLDKREKALFSLLVEAANQFNDPSSVRILSGEITYSERVEDILSPSEFQLEVGYYVSAHLRLSAKNGFGFNTTSNYMVAYDDYGNAEIWDLEYYGTDNPFYETSREDCYTTDDFDYAAVNSALEEYWEDLL